MLQMANSTIGIFTIKTPATLAFPKGIFEKPIFEGKVLDKYAADLILPLNHPDMDAIKQTVIAVAKAKWPGRDVIADFKSGVLRLPFSLGNANIAKQNKKLTDAGKEVTSKGDYQKDSYVLKVSSKHPPALSVWEGKKFSPILEGPARENARAKFYFGVDVLAEVNFAAYEKGDNVGVSAYVNSLASLNKGKRLGGPRDPNEAFSGYAGHASGEDPTAGLTEAVPF
jgi:hypothetical protein